MLAWAKISKQKSIFVKLDFSKAYYLVDWCFLFNVILAGNIKGVKLPGTEEQQFILQYADDTSITISAEKALVQQLVSELETFATTSGLVINWEKSTARKIGTQTPTTIWSMDTADHRAPQFGIKSKRHGKLLSKKSNKNSTYIGRAKLYARGVRTERDYWLQHHHGILIWDEAQTRFPALENVQGWLIITTAIHTHFDLSRRVSNYPLTRRVASSNAKCSDCIVCTVEKVRVTTQVRGIKKITTQLFYRPVNRLRFNPDRY
nr:hypothetical protein PHYPA_019800 [Physcomitrium patens]